MPSVTGGNGCPAGHGGCSAGTPSVPASPAGDSCKQRNAALRIGDLTLGNGHLVPRMGATAAARHVPTVEGMSLGGDGEPTLADVQAAYPHWVCRGPGTSEMFYALRAATGEHVHGEDPQDLSDRIKAAEALIDRAAGLAAPPAWPKPRLTEDERQLPLAE